MDHLDELFCSRTKELEQNDQLCWLSEHEKLKYCEVMVRTLVAKAVRSPKAKWEYTNFFKIIDSKKFFASSRLRRLAIAVVPESEWYAVKSFAVWCFVVVLLCCVSNEGIYAMDENTNH